MGREGGWYGSVIGSLFLSFMLCVGELCLVDGERCKAVIFL